MATYYINPEHTNNGDGTGKADQTGAGGAFNTWAGLVFGAGNTYLQKAGTIATITTTLNPYSGAGITFGSYTDTDDESYSGSTRPQIVHTGVNGFSIINNNSINTTIKDIDLSLGDDVANRRNILIQPPNPLLELNLLIDNCVIHRSTQNNLRIIGSSVTIQNCTIYDCDNDCVYGEGNDITFDNCYIYDPEQAFDSGNQGGGDCIQITSSSWPTRQCNNIWIKNCTLENLNSYDDDPYGIVSIGYVDSTGLIFENNICNGAISSFGGDGVVRYNSFKAYTNTTRPVQINGDNYTVYGNIIDTTLSTEANNGGIHLLATSGHEVYNNTIIGSVANNRTGIDGNNASNSDINIRNNIVINEYAGIRIRSADTVTEDHNLAYGCTYAVLDGAVVAEAKDATTITSNPLLTSGYFPTPDSPAIKAGAFISFWNKDYAGNRFYVPPTIGAYEANIPDQYLMIDYE